MAGRSKRPVFALVCLLLVGACVARDRGIVHVVQRGENLYRIGKAYDVPHLELARRNGIRDPSKIEVGQRIFVPGATRRLPVELITPRAVSLEPPSAADAAKPRPLRWPLASGRVSSGFGRRGSSFHDGIDISAPKGSEVYAARGGRVVYSDRLRGYGNVIIIDHSGGWATVYAHNDENLVKEGQLVRQGTLIARVGETGRASGPNLHFEVRHRNVAKDPQHFLPPTRASR